MIDFARKLINVYQQQETCFQNRMDRAMPVCFTRMAEVSVYRWPWDFFGFWDEEEKVWGEWVETEVDWGKK